MLLVETNGGSANAAGGVLNVTGGTSPIGGATGGAPNGSGGAAGATSDIGGTPTIGAAGQASSSGAGGTSSGIGGAPTTGAAGQASATGGARQDPDAASSCPATPIRKLTYRWLGRSCSAAHPHQLVLTLNEAEIARVPLADSCSCTPGIGSLEVSDPALLAWGVNGANTFRATTTGELSWVTVLVEAVQFSVQAPIWAAWPFESWNDALLQPGSFCDLGYQAKLTLSGLAIDLGNGVGCD